MSRSLRVLLVEDSDTDAKLISNALRRGGRTVECERVQDEPSMRAALALRPCDAILADWHLPLFGALAALNIVKELAVDVPFIIVSGTIGEDAAVEAMRAGAHDYVRKEDLARLVPALERELRECEVRRAARHAHEELRLSEERYRALFDSSPLPKWLFDLETLRFAEVNDAAVRLYGYSREEFLGLSLEDIRPSEDVTWVRQAVRREGPRRVASRHRKKDGTIFDVEIHAHTVQYHGKPHRLAVVQDVSERMRLEEQVRQAQKMEAVGRLAGGVAHDFNNLLSVVLSFAEFVLDDLPPEAPMRADVLEIQKAGERAAELTRQLLLFSRQQVLEPKLVDLNELVQGMDKMLRRIIGEDIDLHFVPGKPLAKVLVDPGSTEQALMNLAVNARDAMPTGGKLTIETTEVLLDEQFARDHVGVDPGPHVMLAVSDTGCGMDKATQARIFEPFFTTKEKGKGTGLGMSTVFGIVRQAGGTIWVYSEPGRGATFKIYLPVAETTPAHATPSVAPTAETRGSETILLVEDEEQVRRVAEEILRRYGYKVLVADGPAAAIQRSDEHAGPIHLLLTDVVMPGMSGAELANALAARRPALKVLCMSGYTDDAIVRHGVIDGRFAYLQKPITPAGLASKVREVLDT